MALQSTFSTISTYLALIICFTKKNVGKQITENAKLQLILTLIVLSSFQKARNYNISWKVLSRNESFAWSSNLFKNCWRFNSPHQQVCNVIICLQEHYSVQKKFIKGNNCEQKNPAFYFNQNQHSKPFAIGLEKKQSKIFFNAFVNFFAFSNAGFRILFI